MKRARNKPGSTVARDSWLLSAWRWQRVFCSMPAPRRQVAHQEGASRREGDCALELDEGISAVADGDHNALWICQVTEDDDHDPYRFIWL